MRSLDKVLGFLLLRRLRMAKNHQNHTAPQKRFGMKFFQDALILIGKIFSKDALILDF